MTAPGKHNLLNENELLLRIAEGDERAFFELFKVYTPVLRAYVWKITRSDLDTEEVVQEAFIRIWLHRDKLPGIDNLSAWIYTIAARICYNHLRAALNHQKKLKQLLWAGESQGADWNTPLELTQMEAFQKDVQRAVSQLSEQRKRVYRLNREEGLKPAAIAELLSMPVGTVKNQLSAALSEIRSFLLAAGHQIIVILYFFLNAL